MALLTAPAPVRVAGLHRAFGDRVVLDGVDLDIRPGEFVALLGRSGSGKSTLLRVLAGLDKGFTGRVSTPDTTGDARGAGRRTTAAVAFQDARLLPWKRVQANVTLGLRGPQPADRARAALAEVGLAEHAGAWPNTLSGGEAQRAALARALVRDPALLLLDEPFAALDALTRLAMHDLVLDLWQRRRPGVLLVTHDVDEALSLADRVLVLAGGRFTVDRPVDLDRPRDRGTAAFGALRRHLLTALGVESA
jgi:sulfonate transport system ATP-binding protein